MKIEQSPAPTLIEIFRDRIDDEVKKIIEEEADKAAAEASQRTMERVRGRVAVICSTLAQSMAFERDGIHLVVKLQIEDKETEQ